MTKVVNLPVVTKLDTPAQKVIADALDHDLSAVVIIGITKDCKRFFASSVADGGEALWMIERAKLALMGAIE